jgi:GxxExxY protein
MRVNEISGQVVDAAISVHSALGPGLLESVYEACLAHELRLRGLGIQRQLALPVRYGSIEVEAGLRIDLVVEGAVVVELKAVDALLPIHTAQLLTYLKLGSYPLGLLLNFNVPLMRNGIKRVANGNQ